MEVTSQMDQGTEELSVRTVSAMGKGGRERQSLGKALAPCAFHFASPFLVLTAKAELCA